MATEIRMESPGAPPGGSAPDEPDALMERVQRLSAEVDRIGDPAARESAQDLLAAVMDLYGEGLHRIVEVIDEAELLRRVGRR